MEKIQHHKTIIKTLMTALGAFLSSGCETPKQDTTFNIPQGYIPLDQNNSKDLAFFHALEQSLQHLGSLQSAFVKTDELLLYRQGKQPYPTNYVSVQ